MAYFVALFLHKDGHNYLRDLGIYSEATPTISVPEGFKCSQVVVAQRDLNASTYNYMASSEVLKQEILKDIDNFTPSTPDVTFGSRRVYPVYFVLQIAKKPGEGFSNNTRRYIVTDKFPRDTDTHCQIVLLQADQATSKESVRQLQSMISQL